MQALDVGAKPVRGEHLPARHLQLFLQRRSRVKLIPNQLNLADFVLDPLLQMQVNHHVPRRHPLGLGPQNLHVQVSLRPVMVHQNFLVLTKLFLLQHPGPGQPRPPPAVPRLHQLVQPPRLERFRPVKHDLLDKHPLAFLDLERHHRLGGQIIHHRFRGYRGVRVPGFLVADFHLPRIKMRLVLVQHTAHPGLHIPSQAFFLVKLVAAKQDLFDLRLAPDHIDHFDPVRDRFLQHLHLEKITGIDQVPHVLFEFLGRDPVPHAGLDVRAHHRVVDGLRSLVTNLDLAHHRQLRPVIT